jgi:hypothetical protein
LLPLLTCRRSRVGQQKKTDRMPEDMPEDMPDRMPEDMLDKMPEDMSD